MLLAISLQLFVKFTTNLWVYRIQLMLAIVPLLATRIMSWTDISNSKGASLSAYSLSSLMFTWQIPLMHISRESALHRVPSNTLGASSTPRLFPRAWHRRAQGEIGSYVTGIHSKVCPWYFMSLWAEHCWALKSPDSGGQSWLEERQRKIWQLLNMFLYLLDFLQIAFYHSIQITSWKS